MLDFKSRRSPQTKDPIARNHPGLCLGDDTLEDCHDEKAGDYASLHELFRVGMQVNVDFDISPSPLIDNSWPGRWAAPTLLFSLALP